jgi:hypothetical protein
VLSPAPSVPAVRVAALRLGSSAIVPAVVPLASKKFLPVPVGLYAVLTAVTIWLARLSRLVRRVWIGPVDALSSPWMEPPPSARVAAGCPPVTAPFA